MSNVFETENSSRLSDSLSDSRRVWRPKRSDKNP